MANSHALARERQVQALKDGLKQLAEYHARLDARREAIQAFVAPLEREQYSDFLGWLTAHQSAVNLARELEPGPSPDAAIRAAVTTLDALGVSFDALLEHPPFVPPSLWSSPLILEHGDAASRTILAAFTRLAREIQAQERAALDLTTNDVQPAPRPLYRPMAMPATDPPPVFAVGLGES